LLAFGNVRFRGYPEPETTVMATAEKPRTQTFALPNPARPVPAGEPRPELPTAPTVEAASLPGDRIALRIWVYCFLLIAFLMTLDSLSWLLPGW
jgi:hypothetical protein